MNSVGIVYTEMNDSVKAQLVRDFLILSGEFTDIAYFDQSGSVDKSIMEELGIPKTNTLPVLYLVYKTGESWPYTDSSVPVVQRDLKPPNVGPNLDPEPRVGYYLKPQGRDGANLTERYLNRVYPRVS